MNEVRMTMNEVLLKQNHTAYLQREYADFLIDIEKALKEQEEKRKNN
jgi:hypothetical protein